MDTFIYKKEKEKENRGFALQLIPLIV